MNYSVVINVHNGFDFISSALHQVYCQSLPPTSVVIIDNCSTDQTSLFLNSFPFHPSIKHRIFRTHKLLPLYMARNIGFSFVDTPFFAFLDVDDLWSPNKCELQLQFFLDNSDLVALTTDYHIIDNRNISPGMATSVKTFLSYEPFDFFINYNVHFSSVMFSRNLIIGLFGPSPFSGKLTILGDLLFFLKLINLSHSSVLNIPLSLSSYTYHPFNTGLKKFYLLFWESFIVFFDLFKIPSFRYLAFLILVNLLTRPTRVYLFRIVFNRC